MLARRDTSNLREASTVQVKEEHVTAATEPVLLGFKDTHAHEVLVLTLNTEVHVCIYHVLKLVRTSSLTRLVDLVDDQRDSVGLFTEGQDLLKTQAVRPVSLTLTLMRSIHLLKRVDKDEHMLVRI